MATTERPLLNTDLDAVFDPRSVAIYGISERTSMRIARAFLDGPQHDRRLAVAHGRAVLPNLREKGTQFAVQPLRRCRRGLVLVDDSARSGLERRCHRPRSLSDVVVDKTAESFRRVPRDRTVKQEEQLVLTLGQVLDPREQHCDVDFLLALHDGRRMLPRADEKYGQREAAAGVGAGCDRGCCAADRVGGAG